jgi:hypothetical protein
MKLTNADFLQLTINSTYWKMYQADWKTQEGRFEDIDFANPVSIEWEYKRAYWLERYSDVLFAKAFLEGQNESFRIYYDTADDTYVITTNYGGDF